MFYNLYLILLYIPFLANLLPTYIVGANSRF